MDTQAFEMQLKADGYTEIATTTRLPMLRNGEHGHHFSVRGLVLDGAFTVVRNDQPVIYRPGEVFAVDEGCLHCEEIGPEGARLLTGKKY